MATAPDGAPTQARGRGSANAPPWPLSVACDGPAMRRHGPRKFLVTGAADTDDGSPGVVSQEGDESAPRDLGEMQRAARIAGPPGSFPADYRVIPNRHA
jgi:hypothetical protein